jgi:hypothetical protein
VVGHLLEFVVLLEFEEGEIGLEACGFFVGFVEVVVDGFVERGQAGVDLVLEAFKRVVDQFFMLFVITRNALFMVVAFHK